MQGRGSLAFNPRIIIIFNQVVFVTMLLLIADIFSHRKNTSSQFTVAHNPCIPTQVDLLS